MPDYLHNDSRINIVKKLISPFTELLNEYIKEDGELWDACYADDCEHVVGTVYIILQNYINSTINDFYPEERKLHPYYSNDKKIEHTDSTRIELIIATANFYKHRDLPSELRTETTKHFNNVEIKYKEVYGESFYHSLGSSSPVFQVLTKLTNNWNLNDLIDIVAEWREQFITDSK